MEVDNPPLPHFQFAANALSMPLRFASPSRLMKLAIALVFTREVFQPVLQAMTC